MTYRTSGQIQALRCFSSFLSTATLFSLIVCLKQKCYRADQWFTWVYNRSTLLLLVQCALKEGYRSIGHALFLQNRFPAWEFVDTLLCDGFESPLWFISWFQFKISADCFGVCLWGLSRSQLTTYDHFDVSVLCTGKSFVLGDNNSVILWKLVWTEITSPTWVSEF